MDWQISWWYQPHQPNPILPNSSFLYYKTEPSTYSWLESFRPKPNNRSLIRSLFTVRRANGRLSRTWVNDSQDPWDQGERIDFVLVVAVLRNWWAEYIVFQDTDAYIKRREVISSPVKVITTEPGYSLRILLALQNGGTISVGG